MARRWYRATTKAANAVVSCDIQDFGDSIVNVFLQRYELIFAQRVTLDESLRQSGDAELAASGKMHHFAIGHHELDRAATDVDEQRRLGEVDAILDSEV